MKQMAFLAACTLFGVGAALTTGPFVSVAVYYLFAVLRPNYLWLWALPEQYAWSQYVAIASIVGTVGLLVGLVPMVGGPAVPFRGFCRVTWAYLAFGLWICVTYFTSLNQDIAYVWLLEYLKIFLMLFVATVVVREVRQVWWMFTLTAGALIYIAYEINLAYFQTGRISVYNSGYGGLDNNGAGLMLAMGVPLAIYAWEGSLRWYRWLFLIGVPALLHAVLMTYSRGAMVSLLVVVPILAIRSKRRWQFAAMAAVLALVIPVMAGQEIRERFFSVRQFETDGSANSRFDSWMAAVRIANDYPLFGVGIRNSGLVAYDYGADMVGRTIHSQYLQVLADSGYPALLLYLLALAAVWRAMWQARRILRGHDDEDSRKCQAMLSGLEASLGVFCVGSAFLSLEVFELPYLIALLGGQLFVIVRATRPGRDVVHLAEGVGRPAAMDFRSRD